MSINIIMPRIGHSMSEGKVLEWLVEEGAQVAAGDPLLTVETDKTAFEVEAPEPGVLVSIIAQAGQDYDVDAVLGVISLDGEAAATPAADTAPVEQRPTAPVAKAEPEMPAAQPSEPQQAAAPNKFRAAPKARRIARELEVDLADVTPTGPKGIITVEDVERTKSQPAASVAAPVKAPETTSAADGEMFEGRRVRGRRAMSIFERGMVKTMSDVWTEMPLFTQQMEVDFGAAIALRKKWKAEGGDKAKISFNDMAMKAVATALSEIPEANAAVDGDQKVLLADINLGLAVASDQGLAVPVLKNVDQLSLSGISMAAANLANKVKNGNLSMDDMGPGSATVSNLGLYGVKAGTSIPNKGQFMLLFLGALEERTVVRDGMIGIAKMVTISATYDHRILDGMTAARLSGRVKELLESPELLG